MMALKPINLDNLSRALGKLKDWFVQIKDAVLTVNGESPVNGDVYISNVETADNLQSQYVQQSDETFIERPTGGDASLSDGGGWLMRIRGKRVHTGYVPEEITMTVTPMEREEGQETITATIDRDTFVSYVGSSGTITLTFSTAWSADPADYGITVTGTPVAGDVITVVYVKEVRGTITQSNPQEFVSTGWNLYNHTAGYARVLKYSDTYGFVIYGEYTSLAFATTPSGTTESITVTDGHFTVPSDGYVIVTGGNNTDTAIWMEWSDWGSGYAGSWMAYTQSVVDLSAVMTGTGNDDGYFPNGLMQVGSYQDEININNGICTSWVERLTYSAENLAAAQATGRTYEYDENYIYLARATGVTNSISVDGSFAAYDHGIEFFTGSDIGVETQTIYGINLKNKLERDVLTISQQTLTSDQKTQVLTNIGGASASSVSTLSENLASVQDNLTAITTGPNVPSDLNSITQTSMCYTNNTTLNRPSDWCIVYTFAYSSNSTKAQLAFCISTDNIYYRRYSSSTWQAWKKVTLTSV